MSSQQATCRVIIAKHLLTAGCGVWGPSMGAAGGLGVTHSKLAHYILAKGPDGTIGFGMARTPRSSPGVSGGPGSAFFPPTPRDAIAPAVGGGGEAAV